MRSTYCSGLRVLSLFWLLKVWWIHSTIPVRIRPKHSPVTRWYSNWFCWLTVFDSSVNQTVQDRSFPQRCSAIPGQNRQEYLPYYSHNALPGIARPQAGPTIPLPRRKLSHKTKFYHLATHNSSASRLRWQPIRSPQLQDWGSHYCKRSRHFWCTHKNVGSVEKQRLSALCAHPSGETGSLIQAISFKSLKNCIG